MPSTIALQVLLRANPQLQDDLPEWRGALDRIMGHSAPATQLLLTWLPQQVYGTARIPHRHSGLRAVLARLKVQSIVPDCACRSTAHYSGEHCSLQWRSAWCTCSNML